jgi:hypothetical protein
VLVLAARVIRHPELAALERRGRDRVERLARGPRGERGESKARRRLAEVEPLVLRELIETLRERPEMLLEQPAARVFQEPPHERERLKLVRREPQSRQFEPLALRQVVPVAAEIPVEDYGSA